MDRRKREEKARAVGRPRSTNKQPVRVILRIPNNNGGDGI